MGRSAPIPHRALPLPGRGRAAGKGTSQHNNEHICSHAYLFTCPQVRPHGLEPKTRKELPQSQRMLNMLSMELSTFG